MPDNSGWELQQSHILECMLQRRFTRGSPDAHVDGEVKPLHLSPKASAMQIGIGDVCPMAQRIHSSTLMEVSSKRYDLATEREILAVQMLYPHQVPQTMVQRLAPVAMHLRCLIPDGLRGSLE